MYEPQRHLLWTTYLYSWFARSVVNVGTNKIAVFMIILLAGWWQPTVRSKQAATDQQARGVKRASVSDT